MKAHLTLKSFEELSIEKLTVAMTLPPPADHSLQKGLPAASPRYARPVTWSSAEEFARVHLPHNATDEPGFWNHWGLNE